MPALTPEQEALKAAALASNEGPWTSPQFSALATETAILALFAQLEAQEAPTSDDIILCGCMPADLGYAPPKLEWDEAPSVPTQTATKEAALQALVDQAQELDMGYGKAAHPHQSAQAVPDGTALVPREATESMMHAAEDVPAPRPYGAVWRAMIAAAPVYAPGEPGQ